MKSEKNIFFPPHCSLENKRLIECIKQKNKKENNCLNEINEFYKCIRNNTIKHIR